MKSAPMAFLVSFVVVYLTIPAIILFTGSWGLFDKPHARKMHRGKIPRLGGIAVFAGLVAVIALYSHLAQSAPLLRTSIAMVLAVTVGIIDDVWTISFGKKFVGQIVAALVVAGEGSFLLTDLRGLFGVHQIGPVAGEALTVVTLVALMNAINLIDGIDGLAGSIGVLAAGIFGFWLFQHGDDFFAILAMALVGGLLAFLRYNISPAKIFMGDSGAVLTGFIVGILCMRFLEMSSHSLSRTYTSWPPTMALAILIVPVFDTLRVLVIRLAKRQNPFKADQRHIHHQLINLGLTHIEAVMLLVSVNVLFIVFAYQLRHLPTTVLTLILLLLATALSVGLAVVSRRQLRSHGIIR